MIIEAELINDQTKHLISKISNMTDLTPQEKNSLIKNVNVIRAIVNLDLLPLEPLTVCSCGNDIKGESNLLIGVCEECI
jgi:hypothetical protein